MARGRLKIRPHGGNGHVKRVPVGSLDKGLVPIPGLERFIASQWDGANGPQRDALELLRTLRIPLGRSDNIYAGMPAQQAALAERQAMSRWRGASWPMARRTREDDERPDSQILPQETTGRYTGRYRFRGPDGQPIILSRPPDASRITDRDRRKMLLFPPIALGLSATYAQVVGAFRQWSIDCADPVQRAFVRAVLPAVLEDVITSGQQSKAYGWAPHEKVWKVRDVTLDVVTSDVVTEERVVQVRTPSVRRPAALLAADDDNAGRGGLLPPAGAAGQVVREERPHEVRQRVPFAGAVVYDKIKDLMPDLTEILVSGPLDAFAGLRYLNDDAMRLDPVASYVVTHTGHFGNFGQLYGKSDLDTAYADWYVCTIIYMFCNRYFERKGDPPARAYAPNNAGFNDSGSVVSGVDIMAEACDRLRTSGYMILPSVFDANGQPLYKFELLQDDQRAEMFVRYIEHLIKQILWAICVPDGAVMHATRVGSFAASRTFADLMVTLSEQSLREQERHINRYLVAPLLAMNFAHPAPCQVRALLRPELRLDLLTRIYEAMLGVERQRAERTLVDKVDSDELLNVVGIPRMDPAE